MSYKLKKARGFWEMDMRQDVDPPPPGHAIMYPTGGGKSRLVPLEDVTDVGPLRYEFKFGWACLDDYKQWPCRYCEDERWNGYHCPRFDENTVDRMLKDWDAIRLPLPEDHPDLKIESEFESFIVLFGDDKAKAGKLSHDEVYEHIHLHCLKGSDSYEFVGYTWHCVEDPSEYLTNEWTLPMAEIPLADFDVEEGKVFIYRVDPELGFEKAPYIAKMAEDGSDYGPRFESMKIAEAFFEGVQYAEVACG